MELGIPVKHGIIIPYHEVEIAASRSGGPGGQHVNTTSTRITVRWNVNTTTALHDAQKQVVLQNLASRLTTEGDLIIHSSSSRSQQQNKEAALERLADEVRKALYVPKKRMKTRTPRAAKEARLASKARHSSVKKMRNKRISDE